MTAPDPTAYELLEQRLDTVLGSDDAATLRTVLASLATRDDVAEVRQDLSGVKDDLLTVKDDVGLLQLALVDFQKDVRHEFELVRKESHQEMTRFIKWMVPTIFGGITAMGAVIAGVVAVVSLLG